MPLQTPALEAALEGVAAGPPGGSVECAQQWADGMQSYAAAVVPPSSTVTAAAGALAASLAGAFTLRPDGLAAMELAFAAFALSLGGGMAGFLAVPPVGPVGFASAFAGAKPETHAAAASRAAGLIDTWMRTATAAPTSGGPAVPWS